MFKKTQIGFVNLLFLIILIVKSSVDLLATTKEGLASETVVDN
jgi:hypothetical protein